MEVTFGSEGGDSAPRLSEKLAREHLECLFRMAGAGRVERPDKESRVPWVRGDVEVLAEMGGCYGSSGWFSRGLEERFVVMARNCLISWSIFIPCVAYFLLYMSVILHYFEDGQRTVYILGPCGFCCFRLL